MRRLSASRAIQVWYTPVAGAQQWYHNTLAPIRSALSRQGPRPFFRNRRVMPNFWRSSGRPGVNLRGRRNILRVTWARYNVQENADSPSGAKPWQWANPGLAKSASLFCFFQRNYPTHRNSEGGSA
jgi:hypothetical protein